MKAPVFSLILRKRAKITLMLGFRKNQKENLYFFGVFLATLVVVLDILSLKTPVRPALAGVAPVTFREVIEPSP